MRHKKVFSAVFISFLAILFISNLGLAYDTLSDEAVSYRILGYQYQRQGYLDKAIECYKKAIELNPEYPTAYNDLGIAREQEGKLAEAEKNYLKALELDHNYLRAHTNLGFLYDRMARYEEAIYHLEKRLEKGFTCDPWTKKVKRKLDEIRKKYAQVIAGKVAAEKEIQTKEDTAKARLFLNQGKRLYDKKEYDQALEQFDTASQLDPKNKEAKDLLKKTEEEVKKKKYEERISLEPIKISVPKPKEKQEAAKLEEQKGQELPRITREPIIREKEKIDIKLQTKTAQQVVNDGIDLYKQAQYEKALEKFRSALLIDPENKKAKDYLGKTEKKVEAERERKKQELAKDHLRLGRLFIKYQQYQKAIDQLNQCLEIEPKNREAKKLLAEAEKKIGKEIPKEEKIKPTKKEEAKPLKEEKAKPEKEKKATVVKAKKEAKKVAKEPKQEGQIGREKEQAQLAKMRYEREKQKSELRKSRDRLEAEKIALRQLQLILESQKAPKEPVKERKKARFGHMQSIKPDKRPLYIIIREHYTKAMEFFEVNKFDEAIFELKFIFKLIDDPDLRDMLDIKIMQIEEKANTVTN